MSYELLFPDFKLIALSRFSSQRFMNAREVRLCCLLSLFGHSMLRTRSLAIIDRGQSDSDEFSSIPLLFNKVHVFCQYSQFLLSFDDNSW